MRAKRQGGMRALIYSARFRGLVYQVVVVAAVIALGWYLVNNTLANLAARGIATGLSFLGREAGFDIGEGAVAYQASDSYLRALVVGLFNTLSVSVVGIILASTLGLVIGIARLSGNWIVARLATLYVEAVRNVPLLLQLFVWYGLVTALPGPRQALQPGLGLVLSNRGLKIPLPVWHETYGPVMIALGVALAGLFFLRRWAVARQYRTGQPFPWAAVGIAGVIGLPGLVFLAVGAPLEWDLPRLAGFNFQGGGTLSPEFVALLMGLSVYTGAFIAEIVRSGILAVPPGQTEAALSLGLTRAQTLRLVILPQALRVIVPPLTSQYLNLTKNSSLAVAIGYPDLVSVANTTINQTGQAVEGVALVMGVFLVISLSLSWLMNWYNSRVALVTR
ncbi:amino acid ABC transporter permease [Magnetospirillum moscoviense]|uniref:Amino acid ABC transporter permease n=1 Tax=Magnetospirillum moscoviense TaxID=1437059 RepID=A0A178MJ86_9PROT|nr:amino acid ABC transporter permease [Magnetospirillum moscoviense]MBF0324785.1 amino acid ABC transporter permease [Alphaproteobacteria bacterium]OAN48736.1 amino acid ABC transporter permease [Magnetospirillum moscoviense]